MSNRARVLNFLWLGCMFASQLQGQLKTQLLSGEVIHSQLGTMDGNRIPFHTRWAVEPLWIPVRHLFETRFPASLSQHAEEGYHVVFTNQDRLYAAKVSLNDQEFELKTSWGLTSYVDPRMVNSIWLSSPTEATDARWHMVMPEPSWWFHVERGKDKLKVVEWTRSEEGAWVFGKNRIASGLHLPSSESGVAVEMGMEKSFKNFRLRLLNSFADLKDNTNPGVDLTLNTSQIMLRHKRKVVYRKMMRSGDHLDVRRFRMELDLKNQSMRFWVNEQLLDNVPFPDDFRPDPARLLVLEAFNELRVTHLEVTSLTEETPPGLDQLWLADGTWMLGHLVSWDEATGLQFQREGETAPRLFQRDDIMGVRFASENLVKVKRDNRDIRIELSDRVSRLHVPLEEFSESALSGQNEAWGGKVTIPLDRIRMIRWNPYTSMVRQPGSPLSQWVGEGSN